MSLAYGSATRQSSTNMDRSYEYLEADQGLFILAEALGMGAKGSEILDLSINSLVDALLPKLSMNPNPGALTNALMQAYQDTGNQIQRQNLDGGLCVTTVLLSGMMAVIGHIGSNRAYLLSADTIDCLTTDHTIEEHAAEMGYQSPGDAFSPMVYSVLGQADQSLDTLVHPLRTGTALLLITDGVYRAGAQVMNLGQGDKIIFPLNDEELLKIITQSPDAQSACEGLTEDAHRRSTRDSASAILITNDYPFGGC